MVSSSTRRGTTAMAKKYQRPHSSGTVSLNSRTTKTTLNKNSSSISNNQRNRFLSSSAPPSSKPPASAPGSKSGADKKTKTATTEVVPNVALASVLGGFVTFVFLYSMNAVGRGDGDPAEGEDPLAQLKAEAQEARDHRDRSEAGSNRRMTPDEIRALESGLGSAGAMTGGEADGDRIITEVAVAAPADIAAIEEEANLKIFRKQQEKDEEPKTKKKPWWRFGF